MAGPEVEPAELEPVAAPLQLEQDVTLNWSTSDEVGSARARVAILLRSRVWLDLPHGDASAMGLEPGQVVRLGFQCGDDRYCAADVRFVEVIRERPLRIAVERPLNAVPVQRRAFFRLRVHLPLMITDPGRTQPSASGGPLPGVEEWSEDEPEPASWVVTGRTEDLSGGGLRFVTDADVQVHERVDVQLGCPPGSWLRIGAEVVRVEPIGDPFEPPPPGAPLGVALAFVRIAQRDQDRIVAYLFECQRQLRRKT